MFAPLTRPGRQRQNELVAPIIRELCNSLDEILLMRLAESEPIKPSQPTKLVESVRLPRLRQDNKQPINLLIGARPPWGSAGQIVTELLIGVFSQKHPRTGFFSSIVKSSLAQPSRQS